MIINNIGVISDAVAPFVARKSYFRDHKGFSTSYGLSECGYDIRLAQDVWLFPGRRFVLASAMEKFRVPTNLMGRVLNKSTWARLGVDVSRSTNLEPGWVGFLTLEITYSRLKPLFIQKGHGIGQVIFEEIQNNRQYEGKYQNQGYGPQAARG